MQPFVTDAEVEAFYRAFRRNVAAFKHELPSMLQQFPGEYVAIFDGKIVDHRPKLKELVILMQDRFPTEFVFLELVSPKQEQGLDMDTFDG